MISHYFKVGAGIIIAVAVLLVAYGQLKTFVYDDDNSYELNVVYENVQGLGKGDDVWLSGVKVGSVSELSLQPDGKAMLHLRIEEGTKILKGSQFSISIGILQDNILNITKPESPEKPYEYYQPGDTVRDTHSPATVPEIMNQAHTALMQINEILAEVKGVVESDDLKQDIFEITENVKKTTEEAYELAKILNQTGYDNKEHIDASIQNVEAITEELKKSAGQVEVLLDNANEVVLNVDKLIANANDVAGDEEVKRQLKETVAMLNESMENIQGITDSINKITSDEEVIEDVRDTIKSTKSTMQNADKAISGFTGMLESINDTEFNPDFEFRYNTKKDLYRANMNVRIFPPKSDVFYLFGFDNLGEDKTTNIQFGINGGKPDLWYRFGLKDSKLGMSFEYKAEKYFYNGELFDPNNLQLNLRAGYPVTDNGYLMIGLEDIFDRDEFSIGIHQLY